jgi:hypothetical protein
VPRNGFWGTLNPIPPKSAIAWLFRRTDLASAGDSMDTVLKNQIPRNYPLIRLVSQFARGKGDKMLEESVKKTFGPDLQMN